MKSFNELIDIITQLRHPDRGCPWDIKQTSKSLIPYMLEETYEFFDAVEKDSPEKMKEELGDLALHIIFQILIAEENHWFQFDDVFQAIKEKLIYRHPHVFEDTTVKNIEEIKQNWEELKRKQKPDQTILSGIPNHSPALLRAQRVQEKVASVGFDWDNIQDIKNKIDEEWNEVEEAIQENDPDKIEEEFGDLLFSIVNLIRHFKIPAELALNQSTNKFIKRFNAVEKQVEGQFSDYSLEELDKIWDSVKKNEK